MREPVKMESGQREGGRLLVLGYQGTLRPVQPQNLPSTMEVLLEPWLAQAQQSLNERVPQQYRVFQDEPIPLESLLLALKNGLIGIVTQAAGALGFAPGGPSASKIFREFPLLSSLVRSSSNEWVTALAIFLQRLHQDESWLSAALQCSHLPPIESISATASDLHAGGHSVLRVEFRGGGCLYYKPRPLTGEWLWHELLHTISRLDSQLHLPTARAFIREPSSHYGWGESVFPEESRSFQTLDATPSAAADYWHAAGALLCLAQHVRLTDLHLGNIIATPRGPAVTDAECFATPNLQPSPNRPQISDALDAILATGLLPRKQESGFPDVSGLFGQVAPVSGIRLPAWLQSSDGRHQFTSVAAELVDHGNAPTQTTPIAVLPKLLDGYRHAADLLIRARKTLLAPGSQWRSVLENHHAPRIVLRDTLTYGLLLSRSLEPQYLASANRRRNAILAELQSSASGPLPSAAVRAELRSILQLHIPRLTILPGSRTLATGSGRAIARRCSASTPAQSVLESIETLSSESLETLHVPALLAAIL
jgi:lantibiotic modifying enzyme